MWDRENASLFTSRVQDVVDSRQELAKKDEVRLPRINEETIPAGLMDPQNAVLSLFQRNPKFENTESISKLLEIDTEKAIKIIRSCKELDKDPNFKIVYEYIMENYISQVFSKRDKNKDWQTESNIRSENIEKAKAVFGIVNSVRDIAKTEIPDSLNKDIKSSQ